MKRLTGVVTHNFIWKAVSLVVAVAVWFIILNIEDPTREQQVRVHLRVDGGGELRDSGRVLLNTDELEGNLIRLTLYGPNSSLSEVRRMDDSGLYAYIDLSPIDISRSSEFGTRLPIRVKFGTTADSYDVLSAEPAEVDVVIDRHISRTFQITAEKTGGDMEGYITSEPVVTPPSVTISGPASALDNVAEVKVSLEVGSASESFEAVRPIEVLDADGMDISDGLEVAAAEASVFVEVGTYAKIPVSTPTVRGTAAEGYRVTGVYVKPREIEVEGNSADIQALNAIQLLPIDITGTSRTRVERYDMGAYLAEARLNVREGSESEVQVTVTVEKEIVKEIFVPVDQVEIRGMTSGVSLTPGEVVRLEVQGINSEIADFEESGFVSYVDVTGLEDGAHSLEVALELPEGIRQVSAETVEVIIGDVPAQDGAAGGEENGGGDGNAGGETGETPGDTPADGAAEDGNGGGQAGEGQ